MPQVDLPEELLQAIFSKFTSPDLFLSSVKRLDTLRAICLVNKQCYRISQPLLYHSIHLNGYPGSLIKSVAEKFAEFPRLATYVRNIQVGCWQLADDERDDAGANSKSLNESLFVAAIETAHPLLGSLTDTLLKGIRLGWTDAYLAFILTQCQLLEVLDLEIPFDFPTSHVHAVLHSFASEERYEPSNAEGNPGVALSKLKKFYCSHWDTENAVKMSNIQGILCKSTLDAWEGHMVNVTGVDEYYAFDIQSWALRRIRLSQSLMDDVGLERLLKCCSGLEYLNVQWGGATVGDECSIAFNKFGQAFRKYGKGLKGIDLDPRDWEDFSDNHFYHPLGDLRPLVKLRHLAVPRLALLGDEELDSDDEDEEPFEPPVLTESLPSSLESLKIQQYPNDMEDADLDSQLFDLINSDSFPLLQSVCIERKQPFLQRHRLPAIGWNDAEGKLFEVMLKRGYKAPSG